MINTLNPMGNALILQKHNQVEKIIIFIDAC